MESLINNQDQENIVFMVHITENNVASNIFLTFHFWENNSFLQKKSLFSIKVTTFSKETPDPGALCWCFFASFARY